MIIEELLKVSSEEVLVFYLGNGWQVHLWKNGDIYLQGLKYEKGKHWITFKKLKVSIKVSEQEFLRWIKEVIQNQTFEWEEL